MRHVSICRVELEKFSLSTKGICEGLVSLNVLLGPIDNTNESKLQRVNPSGKNLKGVGAVVHKVQLGQHTNGPLPLWVDLACKLESFRVDQVDIGRRDSEDDTVGFSNVFANEVLRLLLNIRRLVSDWHL